MAKPSASAPIPSGVNPYPSADLPAPAPLTANSAAVLRDQLKIVEGERVRLAGQRSEMIRQIEAWRQEVDGIDTVLAEMDGTADRYRQRLQSAPAPLGPSDALVLGAQGDVQAHERSWNGVEAPHTGVFSPVPPADQPFGGGLDASKNAAMDGFLGSHAAIGQDGTR